MKKESFIYSLILAAEFALIGLLIWLSLPYLNYLRSSGKSLGAQEVETQEVDSEQSEVEAQEAEACLNAEGAEETEVQEADSEQSATETQVAESDNLIAEAQEVESVQAAMETQMAERDHLIAETNEVDSEQPKVETQLAEHEKPSDQSAPGNSDDTAGTQNVLEQFHAKWVTYTGTGSVDEVSLTDRGLDVYEKMLQKGDKYPEYLLEQVEIYPEILDFVFHYPDRADYAGDVSDQEAGGEEMPFFLQWDKRWGYTAMGEGCIATAGCGPTCVAMVCTYLTKSKDYSPAIVAAFAEDRHYYISGEGTSWSMMSKGIQELGLKSKRGNSSKNIMAHLKKDLPVIVSVGEGDFTRKGHYIVLWGTNGKDEVGVFDPNSQIRSSHMWKLEDILDQARTTWLISKK